MSEPVTVPLVDDHAMVRQGVRAFLETQEDMAVVAEAASGEGAMREAAEHAPDVALMDLIILGTDAVEATRRLKARSPRTRVIVLISYHEDEYIFPAIRAGALSGPEELANAIRKAATGEAVLHLRVARELHGAGGEAPSAYHELSDRELEVLRLIADGLANSEIAPPSLREREDGQEPHRQHPLQATPRRPHPGRRLRLATGRRAAIIKLVLICEHSGSIAPRSRGVGPGLTAASLPPRTVDWPPFPGILSRSYRTRPPGVAELLNEAQGAHGALVGLDDKLKGWSLPVGHGRAVKAKATGDVGAGAGGTFSELWYRFEREPEGGTGEAYGPDDIPVGGVDRGSNGVEADLQLLEGVCVAALANLLKLLA